MDRVVILGAAGFIGRSLTGRLRRNGIEVNPYTRTECDLLEAEQLTNAICRVADEITIVSCAAATRDVGDSWPTFQANVVMAENLANACAERQRRGQSTRGLVFLSSTDVFGLPATELPISESTLPRPTSHYGLSKLTSEFRLQFGLANICPVSCLRLPGVYGPGDQAKSVIGKLCRRIYNGDDVTLTGGGTVQRDYVHVDDLCEVISHCIDRPEQITLNVATGESLSIARIAESIAKHLGHPATVRSGPRDPDRDHDLVFDTSRLRTRFPTIKLRSNESGIRDYVEAFNRETEP